MIDDSLILQEESLCYCEVWFHLTDGWGNPRD